MQFTTALNKLERLQLVNQEINTLYGSTLSPEGKAIDKLIEKNRLTVTKNLGGEVTQKELHLTLMSMVHEGKDTSDKQSPWHCMEEGMNYGDDYKRVVMRNQDTGEIFETIVQNYSQSKAKQYDDKKEKHSKRQVFQR